MQLGCCNNIALTLQYIWVAHFLTQSKFSIFLLLFFLFSHYWSVTTHPSLREQMTHVIRSFFQQITDCLRTTGLFSLQKTMYLTLGWLRGQPISVFNCSFLNQPFTKWKNSNETFWMVFKHCDPSEGQFFIAKRSWLTPYTPYFGLLGELGFRLENHRFYFTFSII